MRLAIVQPVIPKYRIPFFEKLGRSGELDVTVLADTEAKSQLNQLNGKAQSFSAVHLPMRRLGPFSRRPGLRGILTDIDPDAVVLWGNPREITEMRAISWLRRRGIPVGIWSMFYRIGPRNWFSERAFRKMGQTADVLFSYGQRGYEEQVARGTPPGKIVVLHNAIDEQEIIRVRDSIAEGQVERFRQDEGLEGKKVILHLVRLSAIKRADLMLQAFKLLLDRRKGALLVFIGGGPLEDEIKQQAGKLGLGRSVRFLGPIYEEDRLGLWLKASDIFAMATCVGLSIHHAMCYGLPVVTDDSRLTQTAEFEVLQEGVNGFTYPAGDMEAFAGKMDLLLGDDELRAQMSQAAKRRVERDYNMQNMVSNFGRGVERLLQGQAPSSTAGG